MVPGPPARYLIPAEWRDKPLSPSFVTNLARDGIELVYTDEFGSGLGKMPKNNFAPRLDAAYQLGEKYVMKAGYGLFYGAFENRGGNPSLGYNYPFQFTLVYQSPNDVEPNRLPDGSLVGLDARDRIVLDPVVVNANGLTLRGVEFDYKTPRYHNYNVTLQTELLPNHSVEVGYVGTRGRNLETFTGMNNVKSLLPPGTNPQPYVEWPDFARGSLFVRTVGVSSYDSLQAKFQRRYHQGAAVPRELHAERGQDQCRRLAVGRRRRRAPRTGRGRLGSGERHRPLRLPHETCARRQRQLRPAVQGRHFRRLARELGAVDVQRPGADDQLLDHDRSRHGLLRARGRRSVRGQPRREPVLQPGGVREPEPGHRRSGRPISARSAVRAARSPARRCDNSTWASRGSLASVGGGSSRSVSRCSTSRTRRRSTCRDR